MLVAYRLLSPGSEWRLHRHWFEHSALRDLLGADEGLADIHTLYACHDRLLEHKRALFDHLVGRWRDLFNVEFDVLLYDLTSTYFEANPPFDDEDKRRYGYSRDKRPDCVQVVIALVVTPEGLPLAYEVLPGNTADKTTLRDFLDRIERQYGKARRVWVMNRGIPTEATLEEMRRAEPPVNYLVGTPKGRLSKLEKDLLLKPWQDARPGVQVKLLPQDGELYVFAQSADRIAKERAMRTRQLKRLWARLKQLSGMTLTHKELLMKLGAARSQYPSGWRLLEIQVQMKTRASPTISIATNSSRFGAAKAAICCAPISPAAIPPSCGATTSSSRRSKKHSRILRAIWPSGRSTTRRKHGSKRTSSLPSWPTVYMSRSPSNCERMRPD